MQFTSSSILTAALLLASTSLALPTSPSSPLVARAFTPQPDDPSHTPVHVQDLASGATMTCGSTTFTQEDLYKAVQWGTLLQEAGIARGRADKKFPKGRFPHSYTATQFTFNGDCPADDNRQEYPLVKDGPYNGSVKNNQKWGDHRVVYYREPGEIGVDGHPLVYFCGGVTHNGRKDGTFEQCTVH